MSSYNFNQFGHVMSFRSKVAKHLAAGNCERLKDYICSAYDTFNPSETTCKSHPCFEEIKEAVEFIKMHGWKVRTMVWKDIREQIVVISPDGGYYHSKYNHKAS